MSEIELRGLLGGSKGRTPSQDYVQPDYAMIDNQLSKHRGLTLAILWEEYAKRRVDAGRQAYMYSFFSQRYREWKSASDLSLKVMRVWVLATPSSRYRKDDSWQGVCPR